MLGTFLIGLFLGIFLVWLIVQKKPKNKNKLEVVENEERKQ